MNRLNTVEVLKRARNRIIRNGWVQGQYRNVEGAYCALGAILHGTPIIGGQITKAEQYLMGVIGENTTVSHWNDTPGRLKGEVVLAFDQAIKNAKRRHVRGD